MEKEEQLLCAAIMYLNKNKDLGITYKNFSCDGRWILLDDFDIFSYDQGGGVHYDTCGIPRDIIDLNKPFLPVKSGYEYFEDPRAEKLPEFTRAILRIAWYLYIIYTSSMGEY